MTMTFDDWLEHVGLGHCRQPLLDNGIDFDVAFDLTLDALIRCGLTVGDGLRLLKALNGIRDDTAAAAAIVEPAATRSRPVAGERRQLTVMFCDLVGYTELTQRHDGELLNRMIADYHDVCAGIVARYDGHVAQRLGDGLMVYFGWPNLHEDDAERCLRAALEILGAIKFVMFAEPLAVHVGIATGLVVVGAAVPNGSADDGLAVGETLNIAARLQGIAKAGEIVIAPTTRRLVGEQFDIADYGVHALKGIVVPMQTWRVQGIHTNPWRFEVARDVANLTTLIGRDEEIALLRRRWEWARGGAGQVVFLSAEPGIGKSRVAEELHKRIADEPHASLLYQCSSFRTNSALYPIIQQLEFAAGFTRDDTADQKLDKLEAVLVGSTEETRLAAPFIASLLSLPTDRYPSFHFSPQRQKETLLEILVNQVAGLSRLRPVLIVFEDAHWIDPTTQELLDLVIPRLRNLGVLLLVTFRPEYAPHGREYRHVYSMTLPALPEQLGTELVTSVAGQRTLPAPVVARIVAQADGVPLFIEELTKSVLESPLLHVEVDRYTMDEPVGVLAIPTTLSGSLLQRLGRRPAARELAQIGACIGRQFARDLLAAVSPYKGEAFDQELQQLVDTGLVFCLSSEREVTYTFKHALVQDAAYESLLNSKRRELHAQIADALYTTFSDRVENEPEIPAHHYTEAGDLTAAIPLWCRAGELALTRGALHEAVAYLEKGLALVGGLPPSTDRDRLELSLREPLHVARLRWRGWAAPDVQANAADLLRLAPGVGTLSTLLIGLWGTWISTITQGRIEEAFPWAERLLHEGQQHDDVDLRILGHRALLSSSLFRGRLLESCAEGDEVLRLYDPASAARWMELTGNDVGTAVGIFASQALWIRGYPEQAVALSERKDADSRRLGHPFDIGWAMTWGSFLFDFLRDSARMLTRIQDADRIGREQRIPILTNVMVPVGEGLAMLRQGDVSAAATSLRRGITAWNSSGGHLAEPYLKSALAEAVARGGDDEGALGLIEECLEQVNRPGWDERVWLPEILRLKGWLLMRRRQLDDAATQLRAAIAEAQRQEARSWELRSATTLAELLVDRGERAAADDLLRPIYDWFTEGFETTDLVTARDVLDFAK